MSRFSARGPSGRWVQQPQQRRAVPYLYRPRVGAMHAAGHTDPPIARQPRTNADIPATPGHALRIHPCAAQQWGGSASTPERRRCARTVTRRRHPRAGVASAAVLRGRMQRRDRRDSHSRRRWHIHHSIDLFWERTGLPDNHDIREPVSARRVRAVACPRKREHCSCLRGGLDLPLKCSISGSGPSELGPIAQQSLASLQATAFNCPPAPPM